MVMLQLGLMQTNDSTKKYFRSWPNSNQRCLFLPKLAPAPSARVPSSYGRGRGQGRRQDQAILTGLLSRFFRFILWEDDWVKFWAAIFHSAYRVTISSHTQENNMKTRWDKIRRKKTRAPKRSWKRHCCIHCVESQNPPIPSPGKLV